MVRIKDQLKSVRGTYTEVEADRPDVQIQLQPDLEISTSQRIVAVAEAESENAAASPKIIKVHSTSQQIITSNNTKRCNICSRTIKNKPYYSKLNKSETFNIKNPLQLKFKCDVCSKLCCCESDLEDHVYYRHDPNSEEFNCPEYYKCPLRFVTLRGLLRHIHCHVKPFEFQCPEPECDESFITTDRLKEHLAKCLPIHNNNNQIIRTAKKICSRYGKAKVKVHSNTRTGTGPQKRKRKTKQERKPRKKQELLLSVLVPISWECEIEMQVKHYNATLSA